MATRRDRGPREMAGKAAAIVRKSQRFLSIPSRTALAHGAIRVGGAREAHSHGARVVRGRGLERGRRRQFGAARRVVVVAPLRWL